MFNLFSSSRAPSTSIKSSSSGNLMDDIKLCESLFSEDRIGEAYFLLQNIHDYLNEADPATVLNKQQYEQYIEHSVMLQRLETIGKEIAEDLGVMMDPRPWNLWNNNIGPQQNVTVYTHQDECKGIYHFKLEGEIRCPIKEVLPALLENSLYQYWLPMCGSSEILLSPTSYQRIVKTQLNFVLFQKICVNEVRADLLPDGSAVLTIRPVATSDPHAHYLPRSPSARMNLWGSIYIKEEEIIEEFEEEIIPKKGELVLTRETSGSDASLPHLYEEKNSSQWEENQLLSRDLGSMSADLENIYSLNFVPPVIQNKKKKKTTVVKIYATFKGDLLSEIIQDWIFNLAVRSAISMFIPMLEHQASLFKKDGIHYNLIEKTIQFYDQIEQRIRDYQKRSQNQNSSSKTGTEK